MGAGRFVGRAGGLAVALGIGVVILGGTAVAAADTDSAGRGSAAAARADASPAPARAKSAASVAVRSAASARTRGASAAARTVDVAAPSIAATPQSAASTVTPARTAAVRAPSAAVSVAIDPSPTPPSPDATVETPYGVLGQWMINKAGEVADWIGQPYCGPGSTVSNCKADTAGAKIVQEPINTIFVVQADSEYGAKLKLDFALRVSGFGPSCCSSIGYSALVDGQQDPQMPTGGLLGLGILPPLPFGLGQRGLLGLIGYGPAYRDAPFFLANSHLRVFGGAPDGNGNYIFTGSVSEENLDTSTGGLLPTHGYESFDAARTKLTTQMLNMGWLTGASDLGFVAMNNAIASSDPKYTTDDHDGYAQVIALGALFASSPARSVRPA